VKWINWEGTRGFKELDWKDQWVYALGIQYSPVQKLFLRVGVNYGQNPVKTHDGFNSVSSTDIQGKAAPTFNYEVMRIIGFPAIFETHATMGVGYHFTKTFLVNVGYTHVFKKTISEGGGNFGGPGGPNVTLSTDCEGDSYEFGFSWRF
jgi:long-chain fatty acid transport protein